MFSEKDKLEKSAKELDNKFHDLRKKNVEIHLKNGEINNDFEEYEDDAREMPFQARLEEILNMSRISLIIFGLLYFNLEEMNRAKENIKKVRDSINYNYQFVGLAKHCLETLEEILWIIGLKEEFSEEKFQLNEESSQNVYEELCEYSKTAAHYEQLAEKEINRLNSLIHWQEALNKYEHALKINPNQQYLQLRRAKCLLKLSKYTQAMKVSIQNSAISSSSECWRVLSIAYCKQANDKKANECINEALRLDSKSKLAGKQKDLLKKLIMEDKIERLIEPYEKEKNEIKYEIDFLKNSHSNEKRIYNILSIDGGGIRGILPALWLSEIESRIHRPISHLFNMIAGTSTGGIIAAGLSAPWFSQTNTSYSYSNSRPRFLASEILNFYKNEAKELFTRSFFNIPLLREKYTDNGRYKWFNDNFGNMKLDQSLTELVIPAVNENNITQSHIFTSYDGRKDTSKNDSFVDVLMATTAAPTFFPPYKIMNKGIFLDGGLSLNNPASEAYSQAKQYNVNEKNVHVLSLGTGSYIPDPFNPDSSRGRLFWSQNVHNVTVSPKEGDTDRQMYTNLGNRYQRWQIWFENPIELDEFEKYLIF
ncbi:14865_t:CDS:1 [Gigaspora rosea]|nr:14865_t:CDS:1 [Gigaspora rosea]